MPARSSSRRKKLHQPGALPPSRSPTSPDATRDGELIAVPAEWDEQEHGPPPKIRIVVAAQAQAGRSRRRRRPRSAAHRRNRASDEDAYRPRHQDPRSRQAPHARNFPQTTRKAADGSCRSTRKRSGAANSRSRRMAWATRRTANSSPPMSAKQGRFGLPVAHVKERLGLAQGRARGQPDRDPCAWHSACLRARGRWPKRKPRNPPDCPKREDWRKIPLVTIDPVDAKDHDDAVFAEADTDPNNRGGFIATVAIADVAHYVTPGSALDREALERGNSVYFPDRVVPMLPERISNDLCSLKPAVDRAALAVRMVIGADGRKRSHTFHRVLMKSAAKLNYQQAQDAIDGRPDDQTGPLLDPVLRAALRGLFHDQEGARRTRAARSRSARAQNPAQARRHARSRHRSAAPRRAPADRGIHDPRQCRGGGNA